MEFSQKLGISNTSPAAAAFGAIDEDGRLRAAAEELRRVVELTAVTYCDDGERAVMRPGAIERVGDGAIVQPTLRISPDAAQGLMDSLWHCGFRPTEGSGSAGSLAATERHLSDMTAIAMGLLNNIGVKLPDG